MSLLIVTVILSLLYEVNSSGCGYSSCKKTDPYFINVHIVPHTHDDVGWLKTVEEYYWGTKNYIQQASVKNILDSVIAALDKNPERRFSYVETAFIWMWWKHQNANIRKKVQKLVNEGRLEFVSGG